MLTYIYFLARFAWNARNQNISRQFDKMYSTACLWDEGAHKSDINEQKNHRFNN